MTPAANAAIWYLRAIEMWEAHEHGRGVVLAISPLVHNWAIKYCSHAVYRDLDEFEARGFAASDPLVYAAALAALDELERMARAGEPPFDSPLKSS